MFQFGAAEARGAGALGVRLSGDPRVFCYVFSECGEVRGVFRLRFFGSQRVSDSAAILSVSQWFATLSLGSREVFAKFRFVSHTSVSLQFRFLRPSVLEALANSL